VNSTVSMSLIASAARELMKWDEVRQSPMSH
jgi:hypothetical protein